METLEGRQLLSATTFQEGDVYAYWISGLGGVLPAEGAADFLTNPDYSPHLSYWNGIDQESDPGGPPPWLGLPPTELPAVIDLASRLIDTKPNDLVVLVGYSLGGGTAIEAANLLGNLGVEVDVLATIDPVSMLPPYPPGFRAPFHDYSIGSNVKYFFNRWQTNYPWPIDFGSDGRIPVADPGVTYDNQAKQDDMRGADGSKQYRGVTLADILFGYADLWDTETSLTDHVRIADDAWITAQLKDILSTALQTSPTVNTSGGSGMALTMPSEPDGATQVYSWSVDGPFTSVDLEVRKGGQLVDQQTYQSNSGSYNYDRLGLGTFDFIVTAHGFNATEIHDTITIFDDEKQPPSIAINGPSGTVTDAAPRVFSWDISDASGLTSASVVVRGPSGQLTSDSWKNGGAPATGSFDFTSYGLGSYSIDISATDNDGDWADYYDSGKLKSITDRKTGNALQSVTVKDDDPDPPVITFTTHDGKPLIGTAYRESHGLTNAVVWDITDASGVASVEYSVWKDNNLLTPIPVHAGASDLANLDAYVDYGPYGVGTYRVEVSATDADADGWVGDSLTRVAPATITVTDAPPQVFPGGPYEVREGESLTLRATASDADPGDAEKLTYAWDLNNDGVFGDATGAAPLLGWQELIALRIDDDGTYPIAVRVTEPAPFNLSATARTSITVTNGPPQVESIQADPVIDENGTVTVTGAYSDPSPRDTHQVVVFWGNGESSPAVVDPVRRTFAASHVYADDVPTGTASDEYLIQVEVTDDDGDRNLSRTNTATFVTNTASATLTGLNGPGALAFDGSGNLYVTNGGNNTVSKFAPGSTTPSSPPLTGLNGPSALAFDGSGNLYVANYNNGTVSKFAPGSTTPSATLTGLTNPKALAFDGSGNVYVANFLAGTVSKFAPGSTTSNATLTALTNPQALAFDGSGNLYVANYWNTVMKFAPGSTTPSATYTGFNKALALALDGSGNLYVANGIDGANDVVMKFAPGSTTPSATLTGLTTPGALAFDSSGNLYVSNRGANTLSKFAPGDTTPSATLTGANNSWAMVFDGSDNLYAVNPSGNTVSKFALAIILPAFQASLASLPVPVSGRLLGASATVDPLPASTGDADGQSFNHTHQVAYRIWPGQVGPFSLIAASTTTKSGVGLHSHDFTLPTQQATITGSNLGAFLGRTYSVKSSIGDPTYTPTVSGISHDPHSLPDVRFTTDTTFAYEAWVPFQQFIVHEGSALHETGSTFELLMFDWDRGGKYDLIAIKKSGTGTHSTELFAWSGESNFETNILATGTALPETNDNWQFAMGAGRDLVAINKTPGRGKTELSVLTYDSGYQAFWIRDYKTGLGETGANWDFEFRDWNGVWGDELVAIKKSGTSSGKTELYVYGGSMWQTQLYSVATALPATGSNWDFELNSQKDLVAIKKQPDSTPTEAYVLDRDTDYQTFHSRFGTALHEKTDTTWAFDSIDWNGDGLDDLVGFKKQSTGTHSTEVHILSGSLTKGSATYNAPTQTATDPNTYVIPGFDNSLGWVTQAVVTLSAAGTKTTGLANGVAPMHILEVALTAGPFDFGKMPTTSGSVDQKHSHSFDFSPPLTRSFISEADLRQFFLQDHNVLLPQQVSVTAFPLNHTHTIPAIGFKTITTFTYDVASTVVRVNNAPPAITSFSAPTEVFEGQTAAISGSFTDSGPLDTHRVTIDWGDNSPLQELAVPPGTYSFAATHLYADDIPTGTTADTHPVRVTVTDDDTGSAVVTRNLTVRNVAPVLTVGQAFPIGEGARFVLPPTTFTDPGLLDSHTATIDWKDGSPVANAAIAKSGATGVITADHVFQRDGAFSVVLTLWDDDGDTVTKTIPVVVNNLAPKITKASASAISMGTFFFFAEASDPGSDPLIYIWDFGDRSYGEGARVEHYYTGPGTYTVRLTVADNGELLTSQTMSVLVEPSGTARTLLSGPTRIDEGSTYWLTLGQYPSVTAYVVDWGDGLSNTFTSTTDVPHIYRDGPANRTITVTLKHGTNPDTTAGTLNVTVQNVAPSLSSVTGTASGLEGGSFSLSAFAFDPGQDTLTYTWDFGDGFTASGNVATHQYLDDGVYFPSVRVTDDDGTGDTRSLSVVVSNVRPTISIAGDPTADEGSPYALTLGAIQDPGADTVVERIVDWGDGFTDSYSSSGQVYHTFADGPASRTIRVALRDEDGTHASAASLDVAVNNVAPIIDSIGCEPAFGQGLFASGFAQGLADSLDGAFGFAAQSSFSTFAGDEGQKLNFTAEASDPGGTGDLLTFTWDFGDHTPAVGGVNLRSVSHTYADDGLYTAILTVADEDGARSESTFDLAIGNVAPVIVVAGPETIVEGQGYWLTFGLITDPGTDTVTQWIVHWGDGASDTYSGPTPASHVFADGTGHYPIRVELVDEEGAHPDAAAVDVTVLNEPPIITQLAGAQEANEGIALHFTAAAEDLAGSADPLTYIWDFGDDSPEVRGIDLTGVDHTYADNGEYTVTLTVDDGDGGQNTQSLPVSVRDVPPAVELVGDPSTVEASLYQLTLGAITDSGSDTVTEYRVDWGDGSRDTYTAGGLVGHTYADGPAQFTIDVTLVDEDGTHQFAGSKQVVVENLPPAIDTMVYDPGAEEGQVRLFSAEATDPAGQLDRLTYTWDFGDGTAPVSGESLTGVAHSYADNGVYTLTLTVADKDGASVSRQAGYSVGKVPPSIKLSGSWSAREGTAYELTLGQITDPGQDTVTDWIVDWGDENQDTYHLGGKVSHTYADGPASATINVTLVDEDGTYPAGQLDVAVLNLPPEIDQLGGGSVGDEGSEFSFSAAAHDPAGTADTVTYTWVFGDGTDPVSGVGLTEVAHAFADEGDYVVTLFVTDEDDGGMLDTLGVTVNNVAPQFEAGPNETLLPGTRTISRDGVAFTDPGADVWSGTVNFGDGTGDQPLSINQSQKTFDLTHTYSAVGVYTVTVTVDDGDPGGMQTDTFIVEVLNTPPRAKDDGVSTNEDSTLVIDVLADNGNGSDQDAENNIVPALTVSLTSPLPGTLVNHHNGTFTYDPNGQFEYLAVGESAIVTFTYEIQDVFGETSTATVTITVAGANDLPTVSIDEGVVAVNESATATNTGSFDDLDLSDDVVVAASIGSVTQTAGSSGTWTWSFGTVDGPDQSQTVTITATDLQGATSTATFTLTVNNVAPTGVFLSSGTITYGEIATVSFANQWDPSVADRDAGFHYAYATTPDGLAGATYANTDGSSAAHDFDGLSAGVHTLYARIIDRNDGFTEYSTSVTVQKADATIDVSGYTGVYDGNAHGASGTAKGVKGENLAGLNLGDSFTNVPGGTAYWTFTDVTGNYNDASGSVAILINKASSTTVVTIIGGPLTYDGTAQTPATVTVTGAGGLSLSPAAAYANNVNAGTATASYSYAGDANHLGSGDSQEFTISKAALIIHVGNMTKAFGQAVDLAVALGTTVATGVQGETLNIQYYSDGTTAAALVGEYAINGEVSDGTTGLLANYSVTMVPGTLTVAAPNATVAIPDGAGNLLIVGTDGCDVINVDASNPSTIKVNGTGSYSVGAGGHVIVYGLGCDDTISLSGNVSLEAHGGAGNDSITGGAGNDVIWGELGNDTLTGSAGNDVLIGGEGSDRIVGAAGNDILIAGKLQETFDDDSLGSSFRGHVYDYALLQALIAWWSRDKVADNGLDTSGGDTDVIDEALDQLTGSSGADWFIIGNGDKITDLSKGSTKGADGDVVSVVT